MTPRLLGMPLSSVASRPNGRDKKTIGADAPTYFFVGYQCGAPHRVIMGFSKSRTHIPVDSKPV